jgi:uncharacterized protein (DUF1015 family)
VSPIFLIYESPESHAALDAVTQRPPDAEATDEFGNTHRLWRVGDPFEVESVRATMQGRHYYIADGHHRFEAARAYHDEVNGMDSNLVLACCVEAADPGIVIRPIHRLLHATRTDIDTFSGRLTQSFELRTEPVGKRSGLDLLRALPDDDTPVAGIISNGGTQFTITRLRTPETIDDPAERLDVSIITSQLIHGALGVAAEESETEISYIDNADEVLESTRRGDAALGILLRPVRLSQVLDVARAHGRVPAKSTSFTPKVPVGLVMQAFDDRDA